MCAEKQNKFVDNEFWNRSSSEACIYLMKCGALDRRQGAKSDCPGLSYFAAGFCEQGLEIGSIKEADDEKYAE